VPLNEDAVRQILTQVNFPGLSRDIVSFGFVEKVSIDGDKVTVRLNIPTGSPAHQEQLAEDTHKAVAQLDGVSKVSIEIAAPESKAAQQRAPSRPPAGPGAAPQAGPGGAPASPLAAAPAGGGPASIRSHWSTMQRLTHSASGCLRRPCCLRILSRISRY